MHLPAIAGSNKLPPHENAGGFYERGNIMKKLVVWTLLAVMFFATLTAGCGGGSDSSDTGQTESLNDDTGSTDPNSGGRGTSSKVIDLSDIEYQNYTAQSGDILTGTPGNSATISIADGATITLRSADIFRRDDYFYHIGPGLTCEGNATIILEGTNSVKSFQNGYPGIFISPNHTLTIKGSGSLDAYGEGFGAGIGGGWGMYIHGISCGNIVIDGGTITATGTRWAAGIGGGADAECGYITITNNVKKVTATKGEDAPYSIGAGDGGRCGKVTLPDQYIYPRNKQ